MRDKIGKPIMQNLELNMKKLVLLSKDDLDNVIWNDNFVRDNQMEIWRKAYKSLPIQQRITILLTCQLYKMDIRRLRDKLFSAIIIILNMFPEIKSRLKSILCKQTWISCNTIIDAAKLADDLYKQDTEQCHKD
jgi:hypothetical protein